MPRAVVARTFGKLVLEPIQLLGDRARGGDGRELLVSTYDCDAGVIDPELHSEIPDDLLGRRAWSGIRLESFCEPCQLHNVEVSGHWVSRPRIRGRPPAALSSCPTPRFLSERPAQPQPAGSRGTLALGEGAPAPVSDEGSSKDQARPVGLIPYPIEDHSCLASVRNNRRC